MPAEGGGDEESNPGGSELLPVLCLTVASKADGAALTGLHGTQGATKLRAQSCARPWPLNLTLHFSRPHAVVGDARELNLQDTELRPVLSLTVGPNADGAAPTGLGISVLDLCRRGPDHASVRQ